MEGQYYLKWNNHHNTLISVFDSLLGSGKHVDCTLAAEGHELGAHKVVLSACSPYLENLLNKPSEKHPIIIFNDIKYDELKAILEYMYRGEVNVLHEQLTGFLKAAEALQIKGLTDQGGGGGSSSREGTNETERESETSTGSGKRKLAKLNNTDTPVVAEAQLEDSTVISKRKRNRRPSQDKMLVESQVDSSNSCDVPQPTSNPPVASAHVPAITKIETDRLSNASASSGTNQQQQPLALVQTQVVIKEKIEPSEALLLPKTEYADDMNNDDEHIEDLTLDDDEEDDGGFMARPGPSHGDSQEYNTNWSLRDRSMEDSYMTAQDVMGNQNNSQEDEEDVVDHSPSDDWISGRPSTTPNPLRLQERHFIEPIPPTGKKEMPTKRCAVCCSKKDERGKKIRRESRYYCPDCNVGLCLTPCFKIYHTKKDF